MRKNIFLALSVLIVMGFSGAAHAQYCGGGHIVDNPDLGRNNRPWGISCCPGTPNSKGEVIGYRVQGIACADKTGGSDGSDGCSAVCRNIQTGNIMLPSNDFQRQPSITQCQTKEVFAGIACKDRDDQGGGSNSDDSDGCTALCQTPGSMNLRMVHNPDIASNNRPYGQVSVFLPQRVVGIACKDRSGGSDKYDSNDGCTIIVQ